MAADWAHSPLLENAEQLGLHVRFQFADLVEKDRSPFRCPKTTDRNIFRAGERAFEVSEKMARKQRRRDGATIDGNERFICPGTFGIDRPGDDFLSRPGRSVISTLDGHLRAANLDVDPVGQTEVPTIVDFAPNLNHSIFAWHTSFKGIGYKMDWILRFAKTSRQALNY